MYLTATASDSTLDTIETYQGTQAPARGGAGIRASGAGGLMAINCHSWFNKGAGVLLDSNGDGTFIGCQFESNAGHGADVAAADIEFIDCNFYANGVLDTEGSSTHRNINMTAAVRNRIIGCRFSKVRGDSSFNVPNIDRHIYINSSSNYNLVEGCQFNDVTNDHIAIIDSNNNMIIGNMFGLKKTYTGGTAATDASDAGVGIFGASSRNKVNNNTFEMSGATIPAFLENSTSTGTRNDFLDNTVIAGTVTRRADGTSFAALQNSRERFGLVARGQITSGQLLAMFGTPQTIVPAPGAGFCLIFDGVMLEKPAGTAYTTPATSDFSVKYTNAAGLEVGKCETVGFTDQASDQYRWVRPESALTTTDSSINPVVNSPLVLQTLVADLTTGNSALNYEVRYHIVSITPNVWV